MLGRDDHGEGEPLVLLHGVASSRLIWRHVCGPLSAGRRVVAVDMPGFGASQPAGPGFELAAVAGRLADGLGLERFDLVGHSLGGAVAVAVAAHRPDAVRRLILVAPAGLAPRAIGVAGLLGLGAELATHARNALGYRWADNAAARWAMLAATVADPGSLAPDDARLILTASDGGRRIADGVRQALAADLRDDFAAAPMPVGLMWGTADRVVPYQGLDALKGLRPDAAVETLQSTGHMPHVERPREFVAALDRLLQRLA